MLINIYSVILFGTNRVTFPAFLFLSKTTFTSFFFHFQPARDEQAVFLWTKETHAPIQSVSPSKEREMKKQAWNKGLIIYIIKKFYPCIFTDFGTTDGLND